MFARLKATRTGGDLRPAGLEETARVELEARIDRPLSDTQWERDRARLLDFVTILRDWNKRGDKVSYKLVRLTHYAGQIDK